MRGRGCRVIELTTVESLNEVALIECRRVSLYLEDRRLRIFRFFRGCRLLLGHLGGGWVANRERREMNESQHLSRRCFRDFSVT